MVVEFFFFLNAKNPLVLLIKLRRLRKICFVVRDYKPGIFFCDEFNSENLSPRIACLHFPHFLPGGPGSGSLGKSRAGTRVTRYQDEQTRDSIGKDEHPEK